MSYSSWYPSQRNLQTTPWKWETEQAALQQRDVPSGRAANLQNNHQPESRRDGVFKATVGSLFPEVWCVIGLMWLHRQTCRSWNYYASERPVFCETQTSNHRQPVAPAALKNRARTPASADWLEDLVFIWDWTKGHFLLRARWGEKFFPLSLLKWRGTRDRTADLLLLLLTFHLTTGRREAQERPYRVPSSPTLRCVCLFKWPVKQQTVELFQNRCSNCTFFILFVVGFFSGWQGR